ncbi:Heat shock protein 67B2 [Angomonas deanei]|nr:Heat shock protein 67B2 [Angomonas deanei]EPY43501.1 Heat shock protein 67B2 [Angomonas deanei]|eukprot:EPY41724.1 Heat shock protein 67B2 [Angomonas deanei]
MVALVDSITNGTCTDVTIVDVRSKDEVGATGIIPNAHVLPLGEIDKALAMSPEEFETTFGFTKPTEEDHLVLYCLRGMRTEKALVVFKEHGYNKVDTFPGSWIEWSENTKK